MTITTPSESALLSIADLAYPTAGTIGHIILLKPDLALGLGITINPTTDTITTTSAHGFVTGSRFRISSTGTVPTGLLSAIDYYAIVLTPTTFKVAHTLAWATSGTAINIVDAGSGTLTISERPLTAADSLAVLISKELDNANGYARLPISNVGAASIAIGSATKTVTSSFTNNGAANIDYISTLVGFGASSVIGSIAGITSYYLGTESTVVTTAPGQQRNIVAEMRIKPAV